MPAAVLHAVTDWPAPVEVLNADGSSEVVLICEHASNHLPAEYGRLGVGAADMERHIAWDIGAGVVTRGLAASLDAVAFLGTYSRLLVDLNRPFGAPTAIPVRSEATDIPGNVGLSKCERERRRGLVHAPFHASVAAHLDRRREAGREMVLVTIHSFTPVFLGVRRPWHFGVLFDRSRDLAEALAAALRRDGSLHVGINEPYRIERDGDYAVPVYGTDRGLPAVLIEIRHDLIRDEAGVGTWVERLSRALKEALRS